MAEAPLSAEEIAHRGFPSTFRGFDPVEVRAYLVRISKELKVAAARERELQQRLTEAEHRAANPVIDQAMLTRALGEETSRVLVSAQSAAHDLKARAEDSVAGILREAHEQAQRIRAEAEAVLAERTDEAEAAAAEIRSSALAEAQAVVERARREAEAARTEVAEQSRQLVQEAQAARARVLGDLTRRRRIAHTQVEQLRAGRERLLEAYRVVRRTLDEVADELERVEAEARSAASAAGRRAEGAMDAAAAAASAEDGEGEAAGGDDELGLAGQEPHQLPPRPPAEAKVLAPLASAVVSESASDETAQSPAVAERSPAVSHPPASAPTAEPEPAPPARPVPATAASPGVAPEQHVEERKLSSLRILRRARTEPPGGPELDVLEAPSRVEGVRLIAADAAEGESVVPAPPSPPREAPSIMPGVSWAPAPPASREPAPIPPASTPRPAPTPPASGPGPAPAATAAHAEPAPTPRAAPADTAPAPNADHSEPAPIPKAAPAEPEPPAAVGPEPAPAAVSPVDAIFARIRADHAGAPATANAGSAPRSAGTGTEPSVDPANPPPAAEPDTAASTEEPETEESLLQRRDEAIEAIELALVRRLKRALQDEHNDVLDRLRSYRQVPAAPEFLPSPEEQAARYGTAATGLLHEAVGAGTRFIAPDASAPSDSEATDVVDLVTELTEALAGPLRRGVERTIEGHPGDTSVLVDSVGAAYRECRSQRLERLAADAVIAAFSRGILTAAPKSRLAWVVDDGDRACPDCDDNALAGPTHSGEQYPTGQRHPPAHAGCRCLLVLSSP